MSAEQKRTDTVVIEGEIRVEAHGAMTIVSLKGFAADPVILMTLPTVAFDVDRDDMIEAVRRMANKIAGPVVTSMTGADHTDIVDIEDQKGTMH